VSELKTIIFSNTSRYYKIAMQSYNNVENFVVSRDREIKNSPINHQKLIKFASSVHDEAIITVVFSTMTLEAFINEYGVVFSSRSFFQNHLENLNLISKFILIPRINNKTELETDKQDFQDLKWLINLRNDLTHFKIKEKSAQDIDMTIPIKQKDFITEEHAKKAIKTMKNVISLLDDGKLKALELFINADTEE
jgi:hypothetical protein